MISTDKGLSTLSVTEFSLKYREVKIKVCTIHAMSFKVNGHFVQTLCIEKDSYMDTI